MEEKETGVSRFTVMNDEALDNFQLAPRTEAPKSTSESKVTEVAVAAPPPGFVAATDTPPASVAVSSTETKKKRGRPRKYGPDGKRSLTLALSPMPISSSIPLTGEFPNWKRDNEISQAIVKKPQRFEFENPGKFIFLKLLLQVFYCSALSLDLLVWLLNVLKNLRENIFGDCDVSEVQG